MKTDVVVLVFLFDRQPSSSSPAVCAVCARYWKEINLVTLLVSIWNRGI